MMDLKQDWLRQRRLAWLRFCAQCRYRGLVELTYDTWCDLWNTEDLWNQKSRLTLGLTVSKIDFHKEYSRENVALTTRRDQLSARKQHQLGRTTGLDPRMIIRKLT